MSKTRNQVRAIMRRAIGRRNVNDPDSTNEILDEYINNFKSLTMCNEVKLFENFSELNFTIDENSEFGVYTFNDVVDSENFINISNEAFISITTQATDTSSWSELNIYQDPGRFYSKWGVRNEAELIRGYPTDMLFYGNEMVFRTLPEQSYTVQIFGYKQSAEFASTGDPVLEFDTHLRFYAYGAAKDYAVDFRLSESTKQNINTEFARQRKLMLTRTHNQRKMQVAMPRF